MKQIVGSKFADLIGLNIYFSNADEKSKPALFFAQVLNSALEGGIIRFMSSSDLAKEFGHTRQYWDKMMKQGDIPYYICGAGRFTLDIYVKYYLESK